MEELRKRVEELEKVSISLVAEDKAWLKQKLYRMEKMRRP